MSLAQDVIDLLTRAISDRVPWDKHWLDIANYALPDVAPYNAMFQMQTAASTAAAINSVVSAPVAAERSRAVYDQTSLWAVARGTAGFMGLVTPKSEKWHGAQIKDVFGGKPSEEEIRWLERLRDYQHNYRADPQTGFWVAHKAAMRSVWGLGTAVLYVEEAATRDPATPITYQLVPLTENFLSTSFTGVVNGNIRWFQRSARQCVERWGNRCSTKVQDMAESIQNRDRLVDIIHCTMPRAEAQARKSNKVAGDNARYDDLPGNRGSEFAAYFVELETKHLIGEGGYFTFPFVVHHWDRQTASPYSEGPISLALAEIKSLNLLAKAALRSASQAVDPPMAFINDPGVRLDLNAGGRNPGLINAEGKPLAVPLVTAPRPDFAQTVIETKRQQLDKLLYTNLWQDILDPGMTATEAMIRDQQRGELIGPAGQSVQFGLSVMFEREVDILTRRGAFAPDSPLASPKSLYGRDIGVRFTSPLDRLQRAAEFIGMQRLVEFALTIAPAKPEVLERLDIDEMIEIAQEILAAPRRTLVPREKAEEMRQTLAQLQQAQTALQMTDAAGKAGSSAAQGANDVAASGGVQALLQNLTGAAQQAQRPGPISSAIGAAA